MEANPRSILIVDDLRVFLDLERTFFERAGFRVYTAASGAEALERARTLRPDAILLDLYMPDVDGAECCRRIKRDPGLRGTAVIMITSKATEAERRRSIDAGCDGFLTRITPHSEMLVEMERVMSKRVRLPGPASLSFGVAYGLPEQRMRRTLGFDLGTDGLFVASRETPPKGSAIRLEIELAGLERSLRLGGEVIRSVNDGGRVRGFHVRFVDPEPAALRKIANYLREERGTETGWKTA